MKPGPVLVQKFGGTSVSTPERRQCAVDHIRAAHDEGFQVAVVVSAMGRRGDPYATDTLLDLLRADGFFFYDRENYVIFTCGETISVAIMAQALRRAGIPAIGMTSVQAGIFTDGRHPEAEVVRIDTSRICGAMAEGEVPLITGAQGLATDTLAFTTLGRGWSDTSAVDIAIALGADKAEIFTDVPGVAVADPRIVPDAHWLHQVSYAAMLELARFGATVIHPRAVAAAREHSMPLVVRSTFSMEPGTRIDAVMDEAPIVGMAVLHRMWTVRIAADGVGDSTRRRWERNGVMSLEDRDHSLLVGAAARPVLEQELLAADARVIRELDDPQSWVSLVGDADALRAAMQSEARLLAGLAVAVEGVELVEHRLTYLLSGAGADHAVAALHNDLFLRQSGMMSGTA